MNSISYHYLSVGIVFFQSNEYLVPIYIYIQRRTKVKFSSRCEHSHFCKSEFCCFFCTCVSKHFRHKFCQKRLSQFVANCPSKSEDWVALENGKIWIIWYCKAFWIACPAFFKESAEVQPSKLAFTQHQLY